MSQKLVAIGGGESGRIRNDGTKTPYETKDIDAEIVRLSEKLTPHFLLLAHAQPLERQQSYFDCIAPNYRCLGCECRILTSDTLQDAAKTQELIDWADIIYEGGGNTLSMIKLWRLTGFDAVLKKAWKAGKVMCGLSAGANCWFDSCSTDSLRILYGPDQPLISTECLGFVRGFLVPHCDEKDRTEFAIEILRNKPDTIGILLSNCAALEIVGNQYKLICGEASSRSVSPYGLVCFWHKSKFFKFKIKQGNFNKISDLYTLKNNSPLSADKTSPDFPLK